jgi:hypothetical protein
MEVRVQDRRDRDRQLRAERVLLLVTTVLFVLVAAAFLVAWVSSARR